MRKIYLFFTFLLYATLAHAQLLTNNGALIHVQANAGLYVVGGDVRVTSNGLNTGTVSNYGFVEVRGGDVTIDGMLSNYQNYDTTNIQGNLTVATNSILGLGAGSGLRVTDDVVLAANTMVADATSLVHMDGDHSTGGPGMQTIETNVATATYTGAALPFPCPNCFGSMRLNTPGIDLSAANNSLVIQGNLDFNDGPSWTGTTSTGGAAATNTTLGTHNQNIIHLNSYRLVMGPDATFNGVTTGTLSIYDGVGAATATVNHLREFAYDGEIQWYTNAAVTQYMFPIGGNMGSGNTLQHLQVNTSGDPTGDYDKIVVSFSPTMMADIPVNHCLDVTNTFPAVQWTGTWTFETFNGAVQQLGNTGTYDLVMRPVDCAPQAGAVGAVVLHTGDALDAADILNCSASAYDLLVNGLDKFSDGAGYSTPTPPLPVEQLMLTATPQKDYIHVNWTTQQEINCSHYHLERSTDGKNFSVIKANVPGHGTTTVASSYQHPDRDVVYNQLYYYRLQQFDTDGSQATSNTVQAMLANSNNGLNATFNPNPATNSLNLVVSVQADAHVSYKMYDNLGKLVYDGELLAKAGANTYDMSPILQKLAAGTYAVVLQSGKEVVHHRLIRMEE